MNYPVWDLAMGGGVLIAIIAILHVFISHFAVGGGLWLVLSQQAALRRGDAELLAFVRRLSKFFILTTLVMGAVTGVGIWFTIALVSPTAVSALIHAFVWGWAIEWVFFVVEIAAALVYWYGWDRLDRRTHLRVGWIYFGAAFLSLVVINGIITFMLTPGRWLETRAFWDGFFNPTYWPSLAVRTALCAGQAGLLALAVTLAQPRGPARARLVRWNAGWVLAAVAIGAPAALWYRAAFPGWETALAGGVPVLPVVTRLLVLGTAALLLVALWGLLLPRAWNAAGAAVGIAGGLLVFGGGEWAREAGRKPYTIHGYLYSTGLLVAEEERVAADGVLAHTRWVAAAARDGGDEVALGRELYRNHCGMCHTMDGYNGLRRFLAHWDRQTVLSLLPRLTAMRGRMPAWHGDERETGALAAWLVAEGARVEAVLPADPARAGRLAWELSCGLCHTADGHQPLRGALAGNTREDLELLLEMAGEMNELMPPYLGDEAQREALLRYLLAEFSGQAAPGGAAAAGAAANAVAERSQP